MAGKRVGAEEVYFDDFKVTQTKSPVVATNDYYAFGFQSVSNSRENSLEQKYLYNGKELQDELNLGWLDYGARMYMSDIGRWGVIDPSTEKFIPYSGYHYAFNNPISVIDPDGRENVVVVGGADAHGDREKFFNTALLALLQIGFSQSKELSTLAVMKGILNKDELKQLNSFVSDLKEIGYNVGVQEIESADALTNYLNSKDVNNGGLSDARKNDKVTDVMFFGHGYAQSSSNGPSFEPGHGGNDSKMQQNYSWGISQANNLNPGAFNSPNWTFESCNAGTPRASDGANLLQTVSRQTSGTAVGWWGKSDYETIYGTPASLGWRFHDAQFGPIGPSSSYPSAGYKDGTNSRSERVKYVNGILIK